MIDRQQHAMLFTGNSPFLSLSPTDQLALGQMLKPRTFTANEIIHQAGDSAKEIFCILSDNVRISSADAEGRYSLVKDLSAGEWFGFMGYFGDEKRPQDAHASGACQLAILHQTEFEHWLTAYPQIYRTILKQLASYSTSFFSRYFNAVNLTLRSRTAQTLLQIHQWQSTDNLEITQADLAALLGVTREAAGLHLNEMQAQGLIQLGYKKITLLDTQALSAQIN